MLLLARMQIKHDYLFPLGVGLWYSKGKGFVKWTSRVVVGKPEHRLTSQTVPLLVMLDLLSHLRQVQQVQPGCLSA